MVDMRALGRDAPLYEIKANLFKALADPVRIRVLEILSRELEHASVHDLAAASHFDERTLERQLSVLRRHGAVVADPTHEGPSYRLAHPRIGELLAVAKEFLHETSSPPRRPRLSAVRDLDDQLAVDGDGAEP